ncbi:MAG: EAL domain-containing protein [Gammaproteobacteria bacterium]|nr:EAL domain-containing protein [Gammaproteobacteria bacterium]MBQ0840408.1 EAL domain-containing protein [Gammaproteobacteria bacterium]
MKVLSNLWRIYLFVILSTAFALAVLGAYQWHMVKKDADTELRYLNDVSFTSTRAMLDYQKSIFDRLSEDFVVPDNNNGIEKLKSTIDRVVKHNPEIAAFMVRDPEGKLMAASSQIAPINNLGTLINDPLTQYNLQRTLKQNKPVIGSNRFIPQLNKQIIAVHYAVRNNGKVIAVLTSAIEHSIDRYAWNNSRLTRGTILQLFRDDYHFIYSSRPQYQQDPKEYLVPIPAVMVDYFIEQMQVQEGVSPDTLRSGGKLVSVNALFAPGMDALFTIRYEPYYNYYTLTSIERHSLYGEFLPTLSWQIAMMIAFNFLLFLMFKLFNQEQKKSQKRLVFQANHDQLTGLPNRYYLASHFDSWSASCQGKFALFFIDLDNFKVINDHYGHSTGDNILIEVARRIEVQFKDLNIRHGGDEFIIFIPEVDRAFLLQLANNFINDLMQPITAHNTEFSVTSSIGIVCAPNNGSELEVLLSKADIAMYEAKKHRNEAFLFSDELEQRSAYHTAIERELRSAIERNELSMVYQPQVATSTGKTIGVEALVRWNNRQLGIVPPCDFIPIAESIGIMNELGQFITFTAITEIEELCRQVGPLRLSINVSVQQLLTDGFFEFFQAEIERRPNDDLSLTLEVTESMFIEDLQLAIFVLQRFSNIGVEISLDDFGTGFSSLSLLSSLPIHELKIDKSFIDDILNDEKAKRLVHSIISIGKDLKLTTIAEGVEEKTQLAILQVFGCDLIQGYYYSKPLTKVNLLAFLLTGDTKALANQ